MATVTWTLSIDGVTKSLSAWGVLAPRVVFRSLDADEFSFALAGDVYAGAPLAHGQAVSLVREGVVWFVGKVTRIVASRDARTSLWRVTASNAWWDLTRTMWQQDMAAYSDVCGWQGALKTTKVTLNQHAMLGTSITTGQQIRDVITYARGVGIPISVGAVPEFVTLPFEVCRDLTLADVIRRSLQPTPDAVSWCDYGAGTTVLHARPRALLAPVAIDLAQAAPGVVDLELEERRDLVPSGVRLNYIGTHACPARVPPGCVDPRTGEVNNSGLTQTSTALAQAVTITQDWAGAPDMPGGVIGTIDLAQLDANTNELAPFGLAGQYYASLLTPSWQGQLVTREQECTGELRPGRRLNLLHGAPAWATMDALVQEVVEDLFTGTTTATMGPPNHIAPQDFVALVQFSRRRQFAATPFVVTRAPGTDEAPNCDAAKDPEAKKLLDKLKANSDAAAGAIGGAAIADALTGGSGHNTGAMTTRDLELCDGTTVKVYAKQTVT